MLHAAPGHEGLSPPECIPASNRTKVPNCALAQGVAPGGTLLAHIRQRHERRKNGGPSYRRDSARRAFAAVQCVCRQALSAERECRRAFEAPWTSMGWAKKRSALKYEFEGFENLRIGSFRPEAKVRRSRRLQRAGVCLTPPARPFGTYIRAVSIVSRRHWNDLVATSRFSIESEFGTGNGRFG